MDDNEVVMDEPEVLETPAEVEEGAAQEPTPDERDAKIAELEATNKKLFERAKKAEQAKKEQPEGLKTEDIIYLAKADLHQEDLSLVTEEAKLKGMSIQEAHKFLLPILKERAEERATAAATAVGRAQRSTNTPTDESILNQAKSGFVPDDDQGIEALAEARMNSRLKK